MRKHLRELKKQHRDLEADEFEAQSQHMARQMYAKAEKTVVGPSTFLRLFLNETIKMMIMPIDVKQRIVAEQIIRTLGRAGFEASDS